MAKDEPSDPPTPDPQPFTFDPLPVSLDPWDGFVPGPENALAYASVLALARGEEGLSPLVVHGPSGVGK